MTSKEYSPLQALADAIASKKNIEHYLMRVAERACKESFLTKETGTSVGGRHDAARRATMRRKMGKSLDKRYFAGYGRKKTIDRAISKTLRKTAHIRAEISRLEKIALKERECKGYYWSSGWSIRCELANTMWDC